MIVKTSYATEQLKEVEITMTITMPLGSWLRLKDNLTDSHLYPMRDILEGINKSVRKLDDGLRTEFQFNTPETER